LVEEDFIMEESPRIMLVNTNGYAASEDDDIHTISPTDVMSPTERGGASRSSSTSFFPPRSTPRQDASDRAHPRSYVDPSIVDEDDATHDHYTKSISSSYEHRDQLSYSGAASFVYAAGSASFCEFDAASTDAAIQRGADMAYDEVMSVMGHTVAQTIATKNTNLDEFEEHRYDEMHSMPIPILPTKGTDLTDSIIAAMDYDTDYRRTTSNPSVVKSTETSDVLLQRRRLMKCFILFLLILILGAVSSGVICTLGTSCTVSSLRSKSSSLDSSPGASSSSLQPTRAPIVRIVEAPSVQPTAIPQRSPEPSVAPFTVVPTPATKRPSVAPTRSPTEPDNRNDSPSASPVEPPDDPPTTNAPRDPPTDRPQPEPPTTDRPEVPTTRRPSPSPEAPSSHDSVEPTVEQTMTSEPTSSRRRPNDDGPPSDDDR
jgi:hypothetical protein